MWLMWSAKPPGVAWGSSLKNLLVPKLRLGTGPGAKLRFANRGSLERLPKQSFDPGRVTKLSMLTPRPRHIGGQKGQVASFRVAPLNPQRSRVRQGMLSW